VKKGSIKNSSDLNIRIQKFFAKDLLNLRNLNHSETGLKEVLPEKRAHFRQ